MLKRLLFVLANAAFMMALCCTNLVSAKALYQPKEPDSLAEYKLYK